MKTEENGAASTTEVVIPLNILEEAEFKGWGYRHQQCFLLFCAMTIAYSMRVCMSVALVAMTGDDSHSMSEPIKANTSFNISGNVNETNEFIGNATNQTQYGLVEDEEVGGLLFIPPFPRFKWDKHTQDTILSSFFWGYMILQIPAGQLVHRFGARLLLTGALLINCFISIVIPWIAYYGGWILTLVCRITQGLAQACILPGTHTFLGKWAPLEERGRMSAFIQGGQALGTVLGLPITGFIASSPLGWPGIFRFYGILCGIVAGFIWWIIADTPAQHKSMSMAEKRYIEVKLGQKEGEKQKPIPWKQIFRHPGVYAIIVAHIGGTWGQLTLYTEVPAYMDKVMGVNIKANGLLSALPFLVMFFANFFFSWLSDMLIEKNILNVTHTRKLANTVGQVPTAIGFVALAYAPKNIYVVEILLILICSFKVSSNFGFHVNHVDISPNYAGTLMSISNFVANLFGSLAPLVAGFILTDVSDPVLWRKVFFVSAALYFFTNLVYVILGTGEKADWDRQEDDEVDKKENEAMEPMLQVKQANSNALHKE